MPEIKGNLSLITKAVYAMTGVLREKENNTEKHQAPLAMHACPMQSLFPCRFPMPFPLSISKKKNASLQKRKTAKIIAPTPTPLQCPRISPT